MRLPERVELQMRMLAPSPGRPAERVESYVTTSTRWAAVRALSGREYVAAAQAQATVTHEVTLRNDVRIDPAWRLVWRGRTLNIVAVLADARETTQRLLCSEAAGKGG